MLAATTQGTDMASGAFVLLYLLPVIFAVSLGTNRSPIEFAKDWGAACRNTAASG
jgi:hypothetical protein